MEMESAEIESPARTGISSEYGTSTSDTNLLSTYFNFPTTSRPSPTLKDDAYQFDGSSVVVILYFVIVQASIWAFFIFCYFARKRRSPQSSIESNSPSPSPSSDMPPDYASSVNPADYPPFVEVVLDEKPPDYDRVIAASVSKVPSKL